MATISMYYQRPGKGLTIYEEEFVHEDENCLRTTVSLTGEASRRLSDALQRQGLIPAGEQVLTIHKMYFFRKPFNILEFRDLRGKLLGYYSDIGEPARKTSPGVYAMTDLFLDVWLTPEGVLRELDWDEFEEAIRDGVINTDQANLARAAMQRLKDESARRVYPGNYLRGSK